MPDLLEEAKRLSEAATPGPWLIETDRSDQYYDMPGPDDCEFNWRIVPEGLPPGANGVVNLIEEETSEANAEFIARARTLIPELVERVEQERAENERLRKVVRQAECELRLRASVIDSAPFTALTLKAFANDLLAAQQREGEGG